MVALSTVAKSRLKGFSGGMKRRLGIAQALLNDPRLLIVDEPTAGLDPEERIRFRTLLAQLAGDRTVLLSTHIVEDIAQTCRELVVLDAGRSVFRGTVAELTAVADGRVWSVVTPGPEPEGGVIVSVLPDQDGVRYRIVASGQPTRDAVPVAPSLEDGYLALRDDRTIGAFRAG
jgi:ABC-2 type transport system ATP-binding protein